MFTKTTVSLIDRLLGCLESRDGVGGHAGLDSPGLVILSHHGSRRLDHGSERDQWRQPQHRRMPTAPCVYVDTARCPPASSAHAASPACRDRSAPRPRSRTSCTGFRRGRSQPASIANAGRLLPALRPGTSMIKATNSSPLKRAVTSDLRNVSIMHAAARAIARSPSPWPKRSLIDLSPSTSAKNMHEVLACCRGPIVDTASQAR